MAGLRRRVRRLEEQMRGIEKEFDELMETLVAGGVLRETSSDAKWRRYEVAHEEGKHLVRSVPVADVLAAFQRVDFEVVPLQGPL